MECEGKATTKDNLMEAFWQLYEKKERSKITVKEITSLAGYNRSTFYEYFKDVYDVLEQLEDKLIRQDIVLRKKDEEKLDVEAMLVELTEVFERNKRYFSVLLGDKGDPAFQRKLKNRMEPNIKEKLKSVGLKNDNRIDILIEHQMSAMLGIMVYMNTTENPPELREVVEVVSSLNQKGMKETVKSIAKSSKV